MTYPRPTLKTLPVSALLAHVHNALAISRKVRSRPTKEPAAPNVETALTAAVERLLAPLARLAVARGLQFAAVEQLMKRAHVEAARATQAEPHGQANVSIG